MFILKGRQGKTVVLEGQTVKLIKKGGFFAARREKTLPIRNITSVEVKKPGAFVVGFIQFSIAGGFARDSSFTVTGGALGAVQDENSVVFADRKSYETALAIKEYVGNYREGNSTASSCDTPAADQTVKTEVPFVSGIISDQARRYCAHCRKQVIAMTVTPRHLLHFLLSLFTCGLWIPVWILLAVAKRGACRCPLCGTRL